jgi:hypothetical protein
MFADQSCVCVTAADVLFRENLCNTLAFPLIIPFCFHFCLQEQQNLQQLQMDAETQRNAAANSYAMMRARIQQLPQPNFTQDVSQPCLLSFFLFYVCCQSICRCCGTVQLSFQLFHKRAGHVFSTANYAV